MNVVEQRFSAVFSAVVSFVFYGFVLRWNLCGRCDLSTLIMPSSTNLSSSFLMKLCGSLIDCVMLWTVLFPFSISPIRVMLISFFSALARSSFSIGDSMWYFSFRSSSFW